MEAARIDPLQLLQRHQSGDWGDLDAEDLRENDYAVGRRLRIFSAYGQPPDRLWVITEADRTVTTILRPSGGRQASSTHRRSPATIAILSSDQTASAPRRRRPAATGIAADTARR